MPHKVMFVRSSEQDLRELKRYLMERFGQEVWQSSYHHIKEATDSLQQLPLSGTIPPELERLNLVQYRQVIVGMNRMIYEVRDQTVYIHIVCDTRKDLQSLLMQRLMR